MSYDDDEFHEPEMNNYEDNFIPFQPRESYMDDSSDCSTISTNRKKQRNYNDELKKIDKGYHKVKLGGKNSSNFEVELYSTTNTPGVMIRDAVTGSRYDHYKVGSLNEHQFFKTMIMCGTNNSELSTFFFDSPEQYEKSLRTTVQQADKERWTNKCAQIRAINNSK
jgi:hypothetical protein